MCAVRKRYRWPRLLITCWLFVTIQSEISQGAGHNYRIWIISNPQPLTLIFHPKSSISFDLLFDGWLTCHPWDLFIDWDESSTTGRLSGRDLDCSVCLVRIPASHLSAVRLPSTCCHIHIPPFTTALLLPRGEGGRVRTKYNCVLAGPSRDLSEDASDGGENAEKVSRPLLTYRR